MHLQATPPPDPREQRVIPASELPSPRAVLDARADAHRERVRCAKQALGSILDAYYDAFQVLLSRDRLRDMYGERVLDDAFNELLDEKRR